MKRVILLLAVAAVAIAFVGSRPAFAMRDPIGNADGMNLYEYARSAPTVNRDPSGLWTKIERKGEVRARTCAEAGDTWQSLAEKIKLEPSEYSLWAKRGEKDPVVEAPVPGAWYTVPNVIYFDVGPLRIGERLAYYNFWGGVTMPRIRKKLHALEKEGYHVADSSRISSSNEAVKMHLRDPNLAQYYWTGHSDPSGNAINTPPGNPETEGVAANRYTHHKIARMELHGCGTAVSNADPYVKPRNPFWQSGYTPGQTSLWQMNVSSLGVFVGYVGSPNAFTAFWHGAGYVERPGGLIRIPPRPHIPPEVDDLDYRDPRRD